MGKKSKQNLIKPIVFCFGNGFDKASRLPALLPLSYPIPFGAFLILSKPKLLFLNNFPMQGDTFRVNTFRKLQQTHLEFLEKLSEVKKREPQGFFFCPLLGLCQTCPVTLSHLLQALPLCFTFIPTKIHLRQELSFNWHI